MKQRQLGRTGLEVSVIGFGCEGLRGESGMDRPTGAQGIALVRAAHDFGVNWFDAGEGAGAALNEAMLGAAVAPFRHRVALAATVDTARDCRAEPAPRGVAALVRQGAEDALRRLKVDAIDLLWLRTGSDTSPVEDMAGAVADLVRSGKVKHYGLCNATPQTVRLSNAVHRLTAVKTACSLAKPAPAPALLRTLDCCGIGLVASSPLGGGRLALPLPGWSPFGTGALADGAATRAGTRVDSPLAAMLMRLARSKAATPAQLALAWVLARQPRAVALPVARRIGHVDENLGGAELALTADELRELETAAASTWQGPPAVVRCEPEVSI